MPPNPVLYRAGRKISEKVINSPSATPARSAAYKETERESGEKGKIPLRPLKGKRGERERERNRKDFFPPSRAGEYTNARA